MKGTLIILLLMSIQYCAAQDSIETKRKWEVYGYLKSMESLSFDPEFKNNISNNLLHNRINLRWKPSGKITGSAEFRNRLFWGEEVKLTPGFANLLRNDHERFNLQKVWIDNPSLVLHTNAERLNIEYRNSRWTLKLGRQRINWGMTTTWNPNDLFNTYNFLDFDYEERPGVDGGRLRYMINNTSAAELAVAPMGNKNGNIAVLNYTRNQWGYDLQLNTGWYKEHITAGVGWAGSILDAGFKGEMQYFLQNNAQRGHVNLSMEGNYMFKNAWYVSAGMLFNNQGLCRPVSNWNAIDLKLSPENLMPTKWNFIVSTAKEITPLLSVNASVLYAPGTNLMILLPSVKYNLAGNLDADLIWQSFFAELHGAFEAVNHRGFLRIKWSF